MIRELKSGEFRLYSRSSTLPPGKPSQSGYILNPRRGRKARARRAVFQASLRNISRLETLQCVAFLYDGLRRQSLGGSLPIGQGRFSRDFGFSRTACPAQFA